MLFLKRKNKRIDKDNTSGFETMKDLLIFLMENKKTFKMYATSNNCWRVSIGKMPSEKTAIVPESEESDKNDE